PRDIPDSLKASPNERLVLHVHASGFQIYSCQTTAQKYEWALKGPEADLSDAKGAVVGKHYAGPTWKMNDGSEVTGKVAAKRNAGRNSPGRGAAKKVAPDGTAIPWLLLTASGHVGTGILSPVTAIQRVHTSGGLPPDVAGCGESRKGTESKSAYSADYYFYA